MHPEKDQDTYLCIGAKSHTIEELRDVAQIERIFLEYQSSKDQSISQITE